MSNRPRVDKGRSISVLGLVLFGSIVTVAGKRLDHQPTPSETSSAPIYLPQARFLRPMSLGYHTVLADMLWFRTISYFGEHYRSDRVYPWLAYMCDLVTDLDPRADYVYRFGGMVLPWEANQAEEGIKLLEKGVAVLPDSWLLHYWLGFSYYFFRNDYERALQHMSLAAQLPGQHPHATRLAALLHQHEYGPETTMNFLEEMARNADTDEVREVLRNQMREARLSADLERIGTAVAAYRDRFGEFPHSLSALVGTNLLNEIPPDPFGGVYRLDPTTGAVSSSTAHQPSRLYRSKKGEAALRGELPRD